jgi:hypothetical protein
MKTLHVLIFSCAFAIAGVGYALANTLTVNHWLDTAGNLLVSLGTCISGESNCVLDSPDSYIMTRNVMLSSGQKTADAQILAAAGYVSHMICYGTDAASVAGTIILYDSLTETSTAVFTFTVGALDYHVPITFPINTNFATGIYLGYTTTTDVNCTVFYK